ncbi:efflux RND transporter periplasmic adaptor subunit [Solimonas flava]|uniref:efflux RND transporter periplasmic adaptor subunit n=1 Tax=Solimonas flava TaxID=415849 RepID=UPI00040C2700|nr:efflux RND transporter periplasmic adaptor subunit [Solimonas flava]
MKRWGTLLLVVVALVVVVAGVWGAKMYMTVQGFKAMGIQKQTISTIKAGEQPWRQTLTAIGSLRAVRGADLSNEVAGIVEDIHFQSGQEVKAGTLLVQLRAADDIAKLASLKASAELAQTIAERDRQQLDAQAISQASYDTSAANLKTAKAQLAEQQALVDKKSIRAPFAGQLGIRAVDPGQYVAPGAKIVTLQQLDPIYVDFTLPQQALAQIAVGQVVSARSDTYPDLEFKGEISAIDPKVDTDTRNVQVRATLKNPKRQLLPGMYANVTINIGEPQNYLTLPQTAITFNPYGETVFVITTADQLKAEQAERARKMGSEEGDAAAAANGMPQPTGDMPVAKQVFVTVGPTRGDQIAILKGLKAGDEVVTSGQLKLKTGTAVTIDNKVQPLNEADPRPTEE